RIAVHHARQLVNRLGLLRRERGGDVDHEAVVDVATALATEARRAFAAQALDGAVLGAAGHAQALGTVQRRNLDDGALDRLRDRQRNLDLEVLAVALEDRRLDDARDHVQNTRRPGARPRGGLALAGEPDPAAVADARRDV